MIEHDLHHRLVPLSMIATNRSFSHGLRGHLRTFRVFLRRPFPPLLLLNLAIEVGQATLIGLQVGLELSLLLLLRAVGQLPVLNRLLQLLQFLIAGTSMIFLLSRRNSRSSSNARLAGLRQLDFTTCCLSPQLLKVSSDNTGDTIANHNATALIRLVTSPVLHRILLRSSRVPHPTVAPTPA